MCVLVGIISSYCDGEYNFGVYWLGNDELGDLVQVYCELGDVLCEQWQGLVQCELLLDIMVQNILVVMLLIVFGGDGIVCVVFFNLVVCKLLYGGWKLEGQCLEEVLEQVLVELCDVIVCGGDSLFVVYVEGEDSDEDDEQVYYFLC